MDLPAARTLDHAQNQRFILIQGKKGKSGPKPAFCVSNR
jgi:hypothetical protein